MSIFYYRWYKLEYIWAMLFLFCFLNVYLEICFFFTLALNSHIKKIKRDDVYFFQKTLMSRFLQIK